MGLAVVLRRARRGLATGIVGAVALAAASASADITYFTLDLPGGPATFSVNDDNTSAGSSFFTAVFSNYSYNGTTTPFTLGRFYTSANFGGFDAPNVGLDFSGPQLFVGTTSSPTIIPGTYTLRSGLNGSTAQLRIVPAPAAPAPEVGIGWLSALSALGALVLTRRRRAAA